MISRLRWLIPAAGLALGFYVLHLSYEAYAKWQEYIALGDFSGAEAYEVELWAEASIALALIMISAFLVGRWSVAARRSIQ